MTLLLTLHPHHANPTEQEVDTRQDRQVTKRIMECLSFETERIHDLVAVPDKRET